MLRIADNTKSPARQPLRFELVTLGPVTLTGTAGPVPAPRGKLLALLTYLATYPGVPHAREKLMTLLWGSHFEAQSRQNLRKALSRLKQALGEGLIDSGDGAVTLRAGTVDLDTARFETLAASGEAAHRESALGLYQGEVLAGLTIEQSGWTEWLTARRARLERMAIDTMVRVGTSALESGLAERAHELAVRANALDDLREDAHRLLLAALAATGRRAEALRGYGEFEAHLQRELHTKPDPETQAVAEGIRLAEGAEPTPGPLPAGPLLPDKPSIAVLPFENVSDDATLDYLADGVVEELIGALSRLRWLFVISSWSSSTYKNRKLDVRRVGRELGVRYLLEGRIRIAADRVRISTQLVDTHSGAAVLANRFERARGDLFALQDEMTEAIAAALGPGIRSAEIDRVRRSSTEGLAAYDLYLRALHETYRMTEVGYTRARALLEQATALDPDFSDAWACLVDCRIRQWINGWWLTTEEVRSVQNAGVAAAEMAAAADPQNGSVLAILAYAFAIFQGRFEEALELVDRACELQPSTDDVLSYCGQVLVHAGQSDRAIALFEKARRLNPVDPRAYITLNGIAMAHFHAGRFGEAERWSRLAMAERMNWNVARRYHAASLAHLGRLDEARAEILDLLAVQPSSSLTRSRGSRFRFPYMYEQYIGGLRLAGLPEG